MRTQSLVRQSLALLLVLICLPVVPGCGGQDMTGPTVEPNIGPGGPPGTPDGKGDHKSSSSGGKAEAGSSSKTK